MAAYTYLCCSESAKKKFYTKNQTESFATKFPFIIREQQPHFQKGPQNKEAPNNLNTACCFVQTNQYFICRFITLMIVSL